MVSAWDRVSAVRSGGGRGGDGEDVEGTFDEQQRLVGIS
jgi:hypothetical protein